MTAATAAYTLDDAKRDVMILLLGLASAITPKADECGNCRHALADMCEKHGAMAAQAARLERGAVTVLGAQTAGEIREAVEAATEGGVR